MRWVTQILTCKAVFHLYYYTIIINNDPSWLESFKVRKVKLCPECRQMVITINWAKPRKIQGHCLKELLLIWIHPYFTPFHLACNWFSPGKTEGKRQALAKLCILEIAEYILCCQLGELHVLINELLFNASYWHCSEGETNKYHT